MATSSGQAHMQAVLVALVDLHRSQVVVSLVACHHSDRKMDHLGVAEVDSIRQVESLVIMARNYASSPAAPASLVATA